MKKLVLVAGLLAILAAALGYYVAYVRVQDPTGTYPVQGIDVSHHQGEIDWDALAGASNVQFAFIKATEGQDFHDRRFEQNWAESRRVGLRRGAYHFFTFCTPGLDQAEHFLATVPMEDSELAPAADVEYSGNCSNPPEPAVIRNELRTFLAAVESSTGRRPVIYVTSRAYTDIVRGHFDDERLWVRNVFWSPRFRHGNAWAFWQYADRGRLPGIDGNVDLNVYNGTPEQFAAAFRRIEAAVPEQAEAGHVEGGN